MSYNYFHINNTFLFIVVIAQRMQVNESKQQLLLISNRLITTEGVGEGNKSELGVRSVSLISQSAQTTLLQPEINRSLIAAASRTMY